MLNLNVLLNVFRWLRPCLKRWFLYFYVPSDLLVRWPVPAVALAIGAAATTAGVAVTTISAAATTAWRVCRQDPCCRHWVVCTFSWLRPLLRRCHSCVLAASQQPVLWSWWLEYSWLSRWGESYLPWSPLLSPGQLPHQDRPEDPKSRQPENVINRQAAARHVSTARKCSQQANSAHTCNHSKNGLSAGRQLFRL